MAEVGGQQQPVTKGSFQDVRTTANYDRSI